MVVSSVQTFLIVASEAATAAREQLAELDQMFNSEHEHASQNFPFPLGRRTARPILSPSAVAE
jgi:hypothetical protein